MTHRGLVCLLLLVASAWGQAAKPTAPAPATPAPAAAAPMGDDMTAKPDPSKVTPDTAVITIPGVCDNMPADKSASPDCKTVVTRAEFERLLDAVAPNVPAAGRRQLAGRYANGLAMSHEAEKMGLDKGPRYEEMMKVSRVQVLAQELGRALQEKADQVPDKDIQDYYDKNKAQFEEASLHRLFIPKNKQLEPLKEKLSDEATQKRQEAAEALMKATAVKLQARAAAGEDFDKLQGEAFEAAGLKAKAPNTDLGKIRRTALPPAHSTAFDLKTGQVSPLVTDTSGFFVYKMGDRDTVPLDAAKDEIHTILRGQRMQDSMSAMQQAATPALNEDYFGPEPGPQGPNPGAGMKPPMRRPMGGAMPGAKAPAAAPPATTEPK